jgi:D-serine dehydratase
MSASPLPLLDGRTKGLPAGTAPLAREDIAAARWNVLREDLPLPLAVLKESSLAHNSAWMQAFRNMTGVDIAPHGKTSMSPELYARQLADGAWGITVATVQQLRVCREHGISRVVLANQLVGRQAIRYVLDELARDPQFEFCCLVDSVAGVEILASAVRARSAEKGSDPARPLDVLLECGAMGARTGCRTLAEALTVARRVAAAKPALRLIGIEGFEGAIHGATPDDTEARIAAFVAFIGQVAGACAAENLIDADPIVLSAGGSAYFDLVTKLPREFHGRKAKVLIRSGCYLTHDSDSYATAAARMRERMPEIASLGEGLRDALEVWSYVQSLPEPGLAILTMGKRDVSYDQHLPFPRFAFRPGSDARPRALGDGYSVTALNDQHAFMRIPPDAGLTVGDMIGATIAHPCTTFDKWRFMAVVDDDYNVIDAITTYF